MLSLRRAHLLRQLHSLASARSAADPHVESLLITAAELHIRADLGVVDAAEKTLTVTPAGAGEGAGVSEDVGDQASPRSAAG